MVAEKFSQTAVESSAHRLTCTNAFEESGIMPTSWTGTGSALLLSFFLDLYMFLFLLWYLLLFYFLGRVKFSLQTRIKGEMKHFLYQ